MHQWVGQFLYDTAVQFRFSAGDLDRYDFPGLLGEIANKPLRSAEQAPDRHHAQRHGYPLDLGRPPGKLRQIVGQPGIVKLCERRIVANQGLRDHQFTGHIHQAVEFPDIDPKRGCLACFGWFPPIVGGRMSFGLLKRFCRIRDMGRADASE
jgi:hypothetical protein